jgi:hypothetical protein
LASWGDLFEEHRSKVINLVLSVLLNTRRSNRATKRVDGVEVHCRGYVVPMRPEIKHTAGCACLSNELTFTPVEVRRNYRVVLFVNS